jgi:hypothetical protein
MVGWDAQVSPDAIRCDVPGVACPDGAARTGMLHDRWDTHTGLACLSVGPSMEAPGDGIGDGQGLLRRPDTLHGLGVTAL